MTTMTKGYPLDQSPLYKLGSRKKLASILHLSDRDLKLLSRSAPTLYRAWDQTNPKGKTRHIEDPAKPLKRVQRRLAKLLAAITPPTYLYCPAKKRCYISNAARHIGSKQIRNLDISNFYPSAKATRVYWFFNTIMKCPPDVSAIITSLTTRNGHFPCGSPVSGLLGFYAYYDMWQKIERIAAEGGCRLSVYVDDITVSGNTVPEGVMYQIRKCLIGHGLEPKKDKEKFYKNGIGVVTGIIVRPTGLSTPNEAHRRRYTLRAEFLITSDQKKKQEIKRSLHGMDGRETLIARFNRDLAEKGMLAHPTDAKHSIPGQM